MRCAVADEPPPLFGLVVFADASHLVNKIIVVFENVAAANAHAARAGIGDFTVAPVTFSLDRAPVRRSTVR